MKTFSDLIQRIERQELEVTWDKKGLNGSFTNHDITFEIEFVEIDKDVYTIKFFRVVEGERSIDIFNDNKHVGNTITTMKAILRSFVKNKSPLVLGFLARTKDKGRIRLYDKIKDLLGIKNKMTMYSEVFNTHKVYVLHRYTESEFNKIKLDLVKLVYNRMTL